MDIALDPDEDLFTGLDSFAGSGNPSFLDAYDSDDGASPSSPVLEPTWATATSAAAPHFG